MGLFDQGHALVIGVADYQDPGLKLSVPITVTEAQTVTEALIDPAVGAYPPKQVKLLRDAEATRVGVVAALESLAQAAKSSDTAFIFFCGHGVLGEDGLYYLTTQDTSLTAAKQARKDTGISAPLLLDLLRKINAQKLLFIINACFSGHVSPTLAPPDALGAPLSTTLSAQVLGAGEGRVLITASRPTQYSYYRRQDKHTFFGQALVDGLRGQGVASSGGYVGLYELYQHLYARVTAAIGALGGVQEPVLNIVRGVGPFPVALHGGGASGTLNPSAIQQGPPPNTAVEMAERVVVKAVGRGAQGFNIQAGGSVTIDQSDKVVDFGSRNQMGNVNIGDVAGRDLIKIATTSAGAAGVNDRQDLLRLIEELQADVSRLSDIPDEAREDADDELRKARGAGQKDNRPRMLAKLEAAEKLLLREAGGSPAALQLAEAVGTLLQRVLMLKG